MKSTINYNLQSFLAALEPGICSFVMSEFNNRLEEKMQNAVNEIFEEMKKELPNKIKTKIYSVILPEQFKTKIDVIVSLDKLEAEKL